LSEIFTKLANISRSYEENKMVSFFPFTVVVAELDKDAFMFSFLCTYFC